MIIVRYADDLIVGFEHESDARRFLEEMRERLQEFALSLHSEKTRLIEFGRLAVANRKRRGLGKPETFTFLGLTFICSKTCRGKFQIKRKSRRDRMRVKLPRIIARPTTRSPAACRRARVRQGQAFGGAEEAPSLTAAARDGDGNMRSGWKNARGAGRTEEWNAKDDQNRVTPLDKESPIQAVCPNWARTDLCGGREVTRVPTATRTRTAQFGRE